MPPNQRYAETECSPAVCRSGTGRQSRHSRTDGALAGSIAANSAALISATILAFHPDLMLDTASTAACRYWQRHIESANAQGVGERGKNSKSSSFGPWSNLSGRGEMEMDRIVRHQFRHRAISPVHS